ncbi:MAG: M48 family metallopeptidase [Novosphingobium sp.]|nr:M48 family metallopeptidase [Novosphingobium sp.]
MIDWLKRHPGEAPSIELGGQSLPIVVRRLAHARRMTLRLAPDGSEVRISIPRWGRTAEALAFVHSRADWLAQQYAALPGTQAPEPGGTLAYRGRLLGIEHAPQAPRRAVLCGDAIRVGGPAEALPRRLRRWLEMEARAVFSADLADYCALACRPVPGLALSGARRRWGSCAPDGAIRINWRLIMAPDFVRRSVVAHEVAHLVHFDHGPGFHALLGELFEGDLAAANRWLKHEGRTLYAPFG